MRYDGYGVEDALVVADGFEDGNAFGANREDVSGVFDVAQAKDSAGSRAKSGAYAEIGIRRMGILSRLLGRDDQMIVLTHAMASEILGITARSSAINCDLMRAAVSSTSS